MSRVVRILRALTFAGLAVAVAVNLAFVLGLIRTRPQLYGEAEVLFEAARLREHLPLYTDPLVGAADYGPIASRFYVCYPPLWSLVLSFVPTQAAQLFGRVACTAGWFGALFALAHARVGPGEGDKRAGLVAAAYGSGVWVIANLVTSGRPDAIALALAACALARSVRLGRADAWATVLYTLAWWVKPNILAIGVGAVLATALANPSSLKRNLGAALAVTLPIACTLHAWSDGAWLLHFQRSLLQSLNVDHWWAQIRPRSLFVVPILFVGWLGVRGRGTRQGRLALFAFVTAVVWTIISLAKIGAASNYWAEPALAAVAVARTCPLPALSLGPRQRSVAWLAAAVHAIWLAAATTLSVEHAFRTEPARQALVAQARTTCSPISGRVLIADHPGIEHAVNDRIVSPSFQTEWLVLTGQFPEEVLVRDLGRPELACLIAAPDIEHAFFAPSVKRALATKFDAVASGGGWTLYLARSR